MDRTQNQERQERATSITILDNSLLVSNIVARCTVTLLSVRHKYGAVMNRSDEVRYEDTHAICIVHSM